MDAKNLNWKEVTMGAIERRVNLAQKILDNLTPEQQSRARLEECADEPTGKRYGLAKIRKGQCFKIGGGGRNRGNRYAYQVWLVWSLKKGDKK